MPKRKKDRRPANYSEPRKAKPPFPINLIVNIKAIYVVFIVALIGGVAAATLSSTSLGGSGDTSPRQLIEQETSAPKEVVATSVGGMRFEVPEQVIEEDSQYEAILTVVGSDGLERELLIELFADEAPKAVNSFVFLAQQGFYDNLIFFFVQQNFVAQAGDPTCDATGEGSCTGSGGVGYTLPVETTSSSHLKGSLVLPAVIEGEEVHGSQFRILLADDLRLDGKETVFGRVLSGLDAIRGFGDTIPCFGREASVSNPCKELDQTEAPVIVNISISQA